jgi:uroporphyrin-III C-methyltransferase/precorrin-2 dehydrogenase/sirohydrochlorin ferrochelatase
MATAMAAGGLLDPLSPTHDVDAWLAPTGTPAATRDVAITLVLLSDDPEDLTLRQARTLASADRVYHGPDAPAAILDRARADAARLCAPMPADPGTGLSIEIEMAR